MWFIFWLLSELCQQFGTDLRRTDPVAFGRSCFIVLSKWGNIWTDRVEDLYKTMVRKRLKGIVFQFCVLPASCSKRIVCACKKCPDPCSLCLDDDSSYSDFVCKYDLGGSEVRFHLQPACTLDLSLCRGCRCSLWAWCCFWWPLPHCPFSAPHLWVPCVRWVCCHMGLPGCPHTQVSSSLSFS